MEKECRKGNKLNNKGFSLVEIIIVIAIIAILAGALAPQLIKYVGKSREAADNNNCNALKNAVQTALADEDAYDSVTSELIFEFNGKKPLKNTSGDALPGDFITELDDIIGTWPEVKVKNMKKFIVKIDTDKNVSVNTSTDPLT